MKVCILPQHTSGSTHFFERAHVAQAALSPIFFAGLRNVNLCRVLIDCLNLMLLAICSQHDSLSHRVTLKWTLYWDQYGCLLCDWKPDISGLCPKVWCYSLSCSCVSGVHFSRAHSHHANMVLFKELVPKGWIVWWGGKGEGILLNYNQSPPTLCLFSFFNNT